MAAEPGPVLERVEGQVCRKGPWFLQTRGKGTGSLIPGGSAGLAGVGWGASSHSSRSGSSQGCERDMGRDCSRSSLRGLRPSRSGPKQSRGLGSGGPRGRTLRWARGAVRSSVHTCSPATRTATTVSTRGSEHGQGRPDQGRSPQGDLEDAHREGDQSDVPESNGIVDALDTVLIPK